MSKYHVINRETGIVEEADRRELGTPVDLKKRFPDKILVPSEMGKPNKPLIMPGYLFHNGQFWSPQRAPMALSSGPVQIDKEQFLNLFTLEELVDFFNFEDDVKTGKRPEAGGTINQEQTPLRKIRAFIAYLNGASKMTVPSPLVKEILEALVEGGILTVKRAKEVNALEYKRG